MNAQTATDDLPRSVVQVRLTQIRHGTDALTFGRLISQATLWRWCDLAGIESGKSLFTEAEFNTLAAIAQAYRQGKTTRQILEEITNEHDPDPQAVA